MTKFRIQAGEEKFGSWPLRDTARRGPWPLAWLLETYEKGGLSSAKGSGETGAWEWPGCGGRPPQVGLIPARGWSDASVPAALPFALVYSQ